MKPPSSWWCLPSRPRRRYSCCGGSRAASRHKPMTAREFRTIALSLPQASEAAHMGHPDFRVGGRIFATLGYPRSGWGMVKLTPEQQELFVRAQPLAFAPVKGAWGRAGATKDRKSTRLNSSHLVISYAVFCL